VSLIGCCMKCKATSDNLSPHNPIGGDNDKRHDMDGVLLISSYLGKVCHLNSIHSSFP